MQKVFDILQCTPIQPALSGANNDDIVGIHSRMQFLDWSRFKREISIDSRSFEKTDIHKYNVVKSKILKYASQHSVMTRNNEQCCVIRTEQRPSAYGSATL